jgi:hypothetical protein
LDDLLVYRVDGRVTTVSGVLVERGIVHPAAATVGVRLSSWPAAQDATLMFDTLAMFDARAAYLS